MQFADQFVLTSVYNIHMLLSKRTKDDKGVAQTNSPSITHAMRMTKHHAFLQTEYTLELSPFISELRALDPDMPAILVGHRPQVCKVYTISSCYCSQIVA